MGVFGLVGPSATPTPVPSGTKSGISSALGGLFAHELPSRPLQISVGLHFRNFMQYGSCLALCPFALSICMHSDLKGATHLHALGPQRDPAIDPRSFKVYARAFSFGCVLQDFHRIDSCKRGMFSVTCKHPSLFPLARVSGVQNGLMLCKPDGAGQIGSIGRDG